MIRARGTVLGRRDTDTRVFSTVIYPTIWQMKENGQTYTAIAQNLNRMRVKTCNKRAWYSSIISQLLKNSVLTK